MFCVLRVIDGPAQGSQVFLGCNQRLVIGRLSTADFSIPADHHLSRTHLLIESDEMSFQVSDMGSSNGTFVNNSPISRVEISSGDIIRAGKSVFEVQVKRDSKKSVQPSSLVNVIPTRTLHDKNNSDLTERNPMLASAEKTTLPIAVDFVAQTLELMFKVSSGLQDSTYLEKKVESLESSHLIFDSVGVFHPFLYLTVNQSHVSPDIFRSDAINPTSLTRLPDSNLVIVEHPNLFATIELLRACYQKNALVAIAARSPIQPSWFRYWQENLYYPSLLANNIESNSSISREISGDVDWLFFEPDDSSRFALLLNEETLRTAKRLIKNSPH